MTALTPADLKEWAVSVARGFPGSPPIVYVLRGLFHGICLADRAKNNDATLFELQKAALQALEEAQR